MNLHDIVAPCTGAVNPLIPATFSASTGSTTQPWGDRIPTYATPTLVIIDLQGISESDLKHMNALNVGGVLRKIYGDGKLSSVVRETSEGGDLITTATPSATWLVVKVAEQWPDWCSVIVQQQVNR